MKTLKPIYLIIIGSSIVGFLIMLVVYITQLNQPSLSFWEFLALTIAAFGAPYLTFYLLIKRFISERLKILYRSIRKGKIQKGMQSSFRMSDDIITEAERHTESWTKEKNNEISRLKEQEEFRREFLGNLAHELKTPVFAIQGYILTLLDGGLEDEKVNRLFLERASKATNRMTNILEDLDQITKLEVDDLKIETRPFDVIELMQDIIDTLYIRAEDKNISLTLAKDYSPTYVLADKGKIAQVLTNLISNSISYGNEGGNTVLRLYQLDDVVTIEVSDNGPGIEEEHIPRLFERFYRIEKSRNRHKGGSGLGLAIVKHIIESHDQSINVRSTVGIGSTFAFTLEKGRPSTKDSISKRGLRVD